jgi:hypothetical protein
MHHEGNNFLVGPCLFLRHAKVQTTLDLYTQENSDETLAAQGEYLTALGVGSSMVNCGLSCGWGFRCNTR